MNNEEKIILEKVNNIIRGFFSRVKNDDGEIYFYTGANRCKFETIELFIILNEDATSVRTFENDFEFNELKQIISILNEILL